MKMMAPRRMRSSSLERSPRSVMRSQDMRIRAGMIRSLQIMVDSAMAATMTMPVAAERPPMKASSASPSACSFMGMVSTKVSASTRPAGKCSRPLTAMGSTKMLITSI